MATLERRVQVLFDPAVYTALEAEAEAERQSVAAIIRDAVDARLRIRKSSKQEALDRLFASGDKYPSGHIDWEAEKDFLEREHLRDLP